MKRIITVCCVAGALLGAAAETPDWEARIRRDHPRMFFNAETWPQVKARAEGPVRAFTSTVQPQSGIIIQ